jgi:1-acyl-sn-glycerol-3-phosphate acyltransferase
VELARVRLAFLWLSQVARVMADNCLRLFVALEVVRLGQAKEGGGWYLVTFLLVLPAVLLAPFNGALCNSLPKRLVLIGAAAFGLAVVAGFHVLQAPWLLGWALVAVGSAIYGPVRSAFLPAAAVDTRWPLTRINGFFEMGAAAAIVVGLVLGAGNLLVESGEALTFLGQTLASPPVLAIFFNLAALLAALPVHFASDARRPESPGRALAGFFRDAARIWKIKEVRGCLLGLALLRGLLTGMMGALIASSLTGTTPSFRELIAKLIEIGLYLFSGVALGSLLAGLQRHPRRALGLVPWGATGITIGLASAAVGALPGPWHCIILGAMVGLVNVPLSAIYQADLPPDARGNGMAIRHFADYLMVAVLCGLLYALAQEAGLSPSGQFWVVALLAGLSTLVSWWWLLREVIEQIVEIILWPLYRIRGFGPGLDQFPMQGPALVVANHSAWLDPLWLAKVLPRKLIPMMTSVFYDLPVMRWVMVHLAQAIRVEASTFRREVPEIQKAIAALDRGEVVVLFPEGSMRRSAERPLRQFGQGIWHILQERPQTPVFVCWIEGGFGSYFSYWQGRPTKNKKMDFWRHIDIAVGPGEVLDSALLEDQRATRTYLMRKCVEASAILGLPMFHVDKSTEVENEDGV